MQGVFCMDSKKIISAAAVPPPTPFRESVWVLPNPDVPQPYYLSSTGITLRDRNYRIVSSGRKYYVLEYIIAGRGHLFVDDQHFQPSAGDVYLLPPDMPQEYYTVANDPWEKIWFNINGELIDSLIQCYRLPGVIYLQQTNLEALFREGMDAVRYFTPASHAVLAGVITRIFAAMHQLRGDESSGVSELGMRMKNYLDSNLQKPFSLAELCTISGKSATQTLRIFKYDHHITPGNYWQKRRLQIAISYLENTSSSIRHIAETLGFANEFHFSQWFKKQCGKAPSIYRKDLQQH